MAGNSNSSGGGVIAFVLYSGGNPVQDAADTNVDVDVNLPSLPEAPRMP